jgi:hypothetical protein
MLRVTSRILCGVLFGALLIGSCFAQSGVQVNESKVRIQFHSDGTLVILPLENQTGEAIASEVHLELMDPSGLVRAQADLSGSYRAPNGGFSY